MIPDKPQPLTPEERDLAQRLGRLGMPGAPTPALDSRILAAARAAVDGPAVPARQRRRWPVVFGVAASLALAVGVAWQLRPLPDAAVEYSEAPAAAPMETTSAGAADAATVAPQAQAVDAADLPEAARRAHRQPPVAAAAEATKPGPQAFRQPTQRKTTSDPEAEEAVADMPPVSPAAPPPLPPSPATATDEAGATRVHGAAQRAPAATQGVTGNRQDTGGLAPREAAATSVDEYGDQSIDDQPPATADAPEVRQAWLQRIRELIAAGETDAARASLEEFRRRYPDAVLPEDLRAFGR